MFEAGADLTGRDAEDVFRSDFKAFSRGDAKFGVGQSIYMTDKSRAAAEALVGPFLPEAGRREGLPMIFYMFTDMKTQSTDLMYWGDHTEEIIRDAFGVEPKDGGGQYCPGWSAAKSSCCRRCWQHCRPARGSNRPGKQTVWVPKSENFTLD